MNDTLPIKLDRQPQEIGVLPSTNLEDDMAELRETMGGKRSFSVDYNTPLFDEDGEPDF